METILTNTTAATIVLFSIPCSAYIKAKNIDGFTAGERIG